MHFHIFPQSQDSRSIGITISKERKYLKKYFHHNFQREQKQSV